MVTKRAAAWKLLDATSKIAAGALLVSLFASALHDVSRAWDVWYYHLPFAARLAGVVPAQAYVFSDANQARFEGFPLLGEAMQGALWRITGHAQSANLIACAAVPLFAWLMSRAFRVPWQLSVFALLAIPLVQAHATSCYVDLPANAAASVAVLLAIRAHAQDRKKNEKTSRRMVLIAIACAATAANMKVLLGPVAVIALLALGARIWLENRPKDGPPKIVGSFAGRAPDDNKGLLKIRAALIGIGVLAIVLATPLKNAALHKNPWYPLKVEALGVTLAGPERPYSSTPDWLENAPRPARFAASLAEIGLRPMSSTRRWTIDQWMPSDATGYRMGGFFNAYVALSLAFFAWRCFRERSRRTRAAAIGFGILTVIIACMPQSHELRYYMCWMIVLVALNAWLAQDIHDSSEKRLETRSLGLTWMSIAAFAVVVVVTHAGYIYPSGVTFGELVQEHVSARSLLGVHDGERVCVDEEPYNLLWAATFHPPRRYTVQEAEDAAGCKGLPRAD